MPDLINGVPTTEYHTVDVSLEEAEPGNTTVDIDTQGVAIPDPPPALPVVYEEFDDDSKLRGHIFNTPDIKEEVMEIPEWHTRVLLKGLTGRQRSTVMQASIMKDGITPDMDKMYSLMVVNGVRNPKTRNLVFSAADRESLMQQKSGGVIERIAMRVSQLSGLDQTAVEALAKN